MLTRTCDHSQASGQPVGPAVSRWDGPTQGSSPAPVKDNDKLTAAQGRRSTQDRKHWGEALAPESASLSSWPPHHRVVTTRCHGWKCGNEHYRVRRCASNGTMTALGSPVRELQPRPGPRSSQSRWLRAHPGTGAHQRPPRWHRVLLWWPLVH